jgi:hypothetical protein
MRNSFADFIKELNNVVFLLSRNENINNNNNDAVLEITDTSSHRAKMTKAQVKNE